MSVVRITPGKTVKRLALYEGGATKVTDRSAKNGVTYRYRVTTIDQSGNVSTGVEKKATPQAPLFGPLAGAVVTAPPTLQWIAKPKASYYNVQLWRFGGGGQAKAAQAVKILSVWPTTTRYKLGKSWRFERKAYTLTPGRYRWYVWPGLGKRSAKKYGPLIGQSSFTVKAKR